MTMPQHAPVKKRGWLKWVLLALVLLVGLPGGCTAFLFYKLANNDAARGAIARAESHPAVAAKLGTPLQLGRFGSGSISTEASGSGRADLAVPVSGPKGSATMRVKAMRAGGNWTIEALDIEPGDGTQPIRVVGGGSSI